LRLPLPSEIATSRGDDGIVADPSPARVAQSQQALSEVARAVNEASSRSQNLKPLNVVLGHLDHQGFLATNLQTFHLSPVNDDGTVDDPFTAEKPITFASIVNQPVAIQVESIITSMSKLVARQAQLKRVKSDNADVSEIDIAMAETDEIAHNQIVDVLRHGWRAAAEMLARQAGNAGFVLDVSYDHVLVGSREAVVQRMPALRRAYNSLPIARDAVDRFVSSIAPRGLIVAPPEVPEAVRAFAQQEMHLGFYRQYLAHALRDALVTGNGYLAFTSIPPFSVFNLRPDDAVDAGRGMVLPKTGEPAVNALHLRGLDQPNSIHGLGILELALPNLQSADVFRESSLFAHKVLETPSLYDRHDWAHRTLRLAERVEADSDKRLREAFAPMLTLLPEPVPNLYFEGRERL
jgi:hypothetical protein